jgi:hypothetical protein
MYKLKKQNIKLPEPQPYQDEGDGADIREFVDDDTDVSEIDYPVESPSELEYESGDDSNSDTCSTMSEVSNIPQYKNLESNLEEETDFAEINF